MWARRQRKQQKLLWTPQICLHASLPFLCECIRHGWDSDSQRLALTQLWVVAANVIKVYSIASKSNEERGRRRGDKSRRRRHWQGRKRDKFASRFHRPPILTLTDVVVLLTCTAVPRCSTKYLTRPRLPCFHVHASEDVLDVGLLLVSTQVTYRPSQYHSYPAYYSPRQFHVPRPSPQSTCGLLLRHLHSF